MSNLLTSLDVASSGMRAERTRLDVISQNIANQYTTKGVDGEPYKRKQVVFETAMMEAKGEVSRQGVKVAKISDDERDPVEVYMPGHPSADARGIVKMPNINPIEEMVDMVTSTRSYEANVQIINSSRQMFTSTMRIAQPS